MRGKWIERARATERPVKVMDLHDEVAAVAGRGTGWDTMSVPMAKMRWRRIQVVARRRRFCALAKRRRRRTI